MRILKLLLCSCTLVTASPLLAKAEPVDGIAAVVNESIITQSDLAQQVKLIRQQIQQSGTAIPEGVQLERQVLDHLILNEIQLQLAKKTGIHISESALDIAIENIAKQNNMTMTQLRETLTQEGIDYETYRQNILKQMEISQLQQRDILNNIHISEQEIANFLASPNGLGGMNNEFRLGHILIPLPESPTPEELDKAEHKAQAVLAKLRQGSDFATIAFADSSGEQALHGGDLGWRKLPELPTIFEKVVLTLQVNDIPEPIRSSSGFHVIKLLDKRSVNETQTLVEQSLVRHILIKTNSATSDDEAFSRLSQLRQKIAHGEDFEQLAKAHSADLGSASNGGSIGWVTKDVLVPEFATKIQNLALKEISEPFKTPFGWHIVQVLDRKSQSNDETSLKQKARQMIQQRKYEEKLTAWQRQIQDEAFIKTHYDNS